MNKTTQTSINFFVFFILALLAISLQSSIFHWIIGGRVTIQIAIVMMTYICLNRKLTEALLFSFLVTYCLGLITTVLQPVSVFAGFCLCFFSQAIKKQVYRPGISHFARVALGNIFFYHLISYVVTMITERSPSQFRPLDWLLEVLMTALFVPMLYRFFIFVDLKTKRIEASEVLP